jgi:hypothetical protein
VSPRAWTSLAFATVVVWGFVLGLAVDSAPILILAFWAFLAWMWWIEDTSPRWRSDR